MAVDAQQLAEWSELATIHLFQQHPGSSYADMVARADALALYLTNAVSALIDTEANMAGMEAELERLRNLVERYSLLLSACAESGVQPWSERAQAVLRGEPGSES